jgi:D-alanine-D-alanine ligase
MDDRKAPSTAPQSPSKSEKVVILYGGRSGEHEVSQLSAASVYRAIDVDRFLPLLVGVSKEGRWFYQSAPKFSADQRSLLIDESHEVFLPPYPKKDSPKKELISFDPARGKIEFDSLFPVMHGTFCEDGTLQGYLELAEVPYVGCGVLGSSVGMDKAFAKVVAESAGIPVAPYLILTSSDYSHQSAAHAKVAAFGFPCFIKPSNSGSSVGVHKVKTPDALEKALKDAFQYDSVVLVEKAIRAREIELSAVESEEGEAWVSIPGELKVQHEFYSYEAKYLDSNGAIPLLPAPLSDAEVQEAQKLARNIFTALRLEGMARIDLFLDEDTGKFMLNEVNSLPGFTSISMFPKMCEVSGLKYKDLITRLIRLAHFRHEKKAKLSREFRA